MRNLGPIQYAHSYGNLDTKNNSFNLKFYDLSQHFKLYKMTTNFIFGWSSILLDYFRHRRPILQAKLFLKD